MSTLTKSLLLILGILIFGTAWVFSSWESILNTVIFAFVWLILGLFSDVFYYLRKGESLLIYINCFIYGPIGFILAIIDNVSETNKKLAQMPADQATVEKGKWRTRDAISLIFLILVAYFLLTQWDIIHIGPSELVFTVEGNVYSADIVVSNNTGGKDSGEYRLPFQKTLKMSAGEYAYISAQGNSSGDMTCKLTKNGKVWKQENTHLLYGIVICSGFVP